MEDPQQFARQPSLVRARRVMSSSVFRALRSAGYPDSGIIEFATSLLSELCDAKGADGGNPPVDVRTGFPTGRALRGDPRVRGGFAPEAPHPLLGVIVVDAPHEGAVHRDGALCRREPHRRCVQSRCGARTRPGRPTGASSSCCCPEREPGRRGHRTRHPPGALVCAVSRGARPEVRHGRLAGQMSDGARVVRCRAELAAGRRARCDAGSARRPSCCAVRSRWRCAAERRWRRPNRRDRGPRRARRRDLGHRSHECRCIRRCDVRVGHEPRGDAREVLSLRASPVYAQIAAPMRRRGSATEKIGEACRARASDSRVPRKSHSPTTPCCDRSWSTSSRAIDRSRACASGWPSARPTSSPAAPRTSPTAR